MRRFRLLPLALLTAVVGFLGAAGPTGDAPPDWGFFGHRRINRLATFTLPPEMMPAFRRNIDYLSEHAVDPDKRRYAAEEEAVRHYIDLDRYDRLPRDVAEARWAYGSVVEIAGAGDTSRWFPDTILYAEDVVLLRSDAQTVDLPWRAFRNLWYRPDLNHRDSLLALGLPVKAPEVRLLTSFGTHGMLPYHLLAHHRRLTQAFVDRRADRVWQLAAEMGHYVGDAHVPLHTTENYNGQLTGQEGIHAFWESRLPELFADREYDYFVGPADYIDDPRTYYWSVVEDSHRLVDSVLQTERRLRAEFAADRQLCYEERSGRTVLTQCSEFARAWSEAMDGMVEDRFRAAIRSVGSVWYSCWVDAGQPELDFLGDGAQEVAADTLATSPSDHPLRAYE